MALLKTNRYDDGWATAIQNRAFRRKFFPALIANLLILFFLPHFFQAIEKRTGPPLNDLLLARLPAIDLSLPIFGVIWCMAFLFFIRSIQSPRLFLVFLYGYFLVFLTRMLSIYLIPLNPPEQLIPLIDPISNSFYGKTFITRDLFYSGHTATLCLFFFCFRRKLDKMFCFCFTIALAIMLLIQHVHYTIDVLAAPLFTYFCYETGKRLLGKNHIPGNFSSFD